MFHMASEDKMAEARERGRANGRTRSKVRAGESALRTMYRPPTCERCGEDKRLSPRRMLAGDTLHLCGECSIAMRDEVMP